MTYTTHQALADQLAATEETFDAIQYAAEDAEQFEGQDAFDALHDQPLEITQQRYVCVVLTTGGPHIVATADFSENGTIHNSRLVGVWGGERIEQQIHVGSGLYWALDHYVEVLLS
jgi:hypothetical protein